MPVFSLISHLLRVEGREAASCFVKDARFKKKTGIDNAIFDA